MGSGDALGWGMHTNDTGELSTQKFGGHTKAFTRIILGLLVFICIHRQSWVYTTVNILKTIELFTLNG